MVAQTVYNFEGKEYIVDITYKRIKNIHFRFDGEKFLISCPRRTKPAMIKSGLDKYAKKLIDRCVKSNAIGDKHIYLFGHKIPLSYPGAIRFSKDKLIVFEEQEELMKKLRKYFLNYIQGRTLFYEEKMKAPNYLVKVRQMKTRYGSNNRAKKTLTFSLTLIHYSVEIIDSVIIHELAHCFVYDHSDNFYRVVYKYCPRYDELRQKLIKAVFA